MRKPEPKQTLVISPTATPPLYYWSANLENLILINNTIEGATTSGCKSGINAFYYDTNNKPLGWLVIDGYKINKVHRSSLLDGFVYVKDDRFQISDIEPEEADFGHQSGPILFSNLDNVVKDRRSVAIQTTDDKAVFAYFEESTLAELLQKVNDLGIKEGFKVKNAINLDGGSSAAFWTEETKVSEMFKVGGWWCQIKFKV